MWLASGKYRPGDGCKCIGHEYIGHAIKAEGRLIGDETGLGLVIKTFSLGLGWVCEYGQRAVASGSPVAEGGD